MATADKKSPAKTAKSSAAMAKKPSGPKTIDILVEAIKALDDPKGASIQAIKNYVLTQYPDKDPNFMKTSLKKAIQKGFDEELLVRPKKSEITGASLSGRLKLNKAKIAQDEKAAKAKLKVKEKKATKKEKPDKETKPKAATKKKTAAKTTKSTKSPKKSPKKKTTEKATKSKAKSPKKTPTKKETKSKTPTKPKVKKMTKTPMKTTKGKTVKTPKAK